MSDWREYITEQPEYPAMATLQQTVQWMQDRPGQTGPGSLQQVEACVERHRASRRAYYRKRGGHKPLTAAQRAKRVERMRQWRQQRREELALRTSDMTYEEYKARYAA